MKAYPTCRRCGEEQAVYAIQDQENEAGVVYVCDDCLDVFDRILSDTEDE